jgi:predicted Zn-dependent peptidase
VIKLSTLAVAACALLLSVPAAADGAATSPSEAHFRLSNGLDVLIEENHREPHVAVVVAYDVGARDEPEGYASLAHLVEHLTYRRSRHLKDYAGLELLGRAGVQTMNGETRDDRTLYYAVVPSKALPLALFLESERMGFTLEAFDEASFDHEREVVRAEAQSKAVGHRINSLILTALYGADHPYFKPASPVQDLDELRLRDAQWFFQHGYRPDNAHLILVGDITLGAGRALAERYFGGLVNPALPLAPRRPLAPARASGVRVTYRSHDYTSLVVAAYRAPSYGSRAHLAAELLLRALGTLVTSELVDHERLALFLKVELNDTAIDSQFLFETSPRQGVSLESLETALGQVLAKLTPERLASVLHQARSALLEHEWMTLEDPLARARAHVEALAFDGRPYDAEQRIHTLLGLTEADLTPLLASFSRPLVVVDTLHDGSVGNAGVVEVTTP